MTSSTSDSPRQSPPPYPSPSAILTMAVEKMEPGRSTPGDLRIHVSQRPHPISAPPSAMSNSSISPNSLHASPTLSPATTGTMVTANSSIQDSPEALEPFPGKGYQGHEAPVPPLRLPDAITGPRMDPRLSHQNSTISLVQNSGNSGRPSGPTAMGQVTKTSLIRRASNSMKKVTEFLPGRRASSTHPNSRDGSVGPGVLRGRRGSTSNPEPTSAILIDSDDDCAIEKDDSPLLFGSCDGTPREFSPLSAMAMASSAASASPSQDALTTGPVVPLILRQGTLLTKVSKQKAQKQILLRLDPDAAKISWDRKDRSRASKTIYIDDIKEIRKAEDIRQYRLDSGLDESQEPRFFSIIYTVSDKPGNKVLHLVADTDRVFREWSETLDAITKHRQDFCLSLMAFNDKAIRVYWRNEMARQHGPQYGASEEGDMDFPGVERMCRSLHIHVASHVLRDKFNRVKARQTSRDDLPSSQTPPSRLNFAEFLEFVRLMKTRKDIREVYRKNTGDIESGMTKEEFLRFLQEVQRENIQDMPHWENVFNRFARKGKTRDAKRQAVEGEEKLTISETALADFLTSTSNPIIPKMTTGTDHLRRPMNEYYISSSHNTYLLGWQVAGESSVEGYISALLRGCRCVEIDIWDGDDDQPMVSHGHTFTSSISFLEVIKTINKYAFEAVQTPLWISLEVRCRSKTQENMARIMKDIFKDKLVQKPIPGLEPNQLPSPEQLLNRILIKVKQSQHTEEPVRGTDRLVRKRGNSLPSSYTRAMSFESIPTPSSTSPLLSPSRQMTARINTITEGEVHEAVSSSPSECESDSEKDLTRKVNSKINPALGELGVYCMGIHFDGFDTPEAKLFNHIFSFKERTFAEKSQPGPAKRALYLHNMKYLMRVYPNGSRISSNNFDPLLYWKRGVQMAALNWQTFDLGMQMNYAMFDGGPDSSGYVLKPIEGRQIQLVEKEVADKYPGKRPRKNVIFKIDVISAQQLMRPSRLGDKRSFDPYVEVEVFLADDKRNNAEASPNAPAPDSQLKYCTKAIPQNGFNPEFNESFGFNVTTKYPDLIFVRWSVKLADRTRSPPIATYMAKLCNLKEGYRTVPLLDHHGDRYLFSTLFCHITKDPITERFVDPPEEVSRSGNKLRNIGRTVFNASNGSPKSSMEGSQ